MWRFQNFFFPLLEMWRFNFFFGNFPKCSLHHVWFHGGLFNRFSSQKINNIKLKLTALRLCVCLSWFKEIGGFHSIRRSRVRTSVIKSYSSLMPYMLGTCLMDRLMSKHINIQRRSDPHTLFLCF
jgi:hypothetical protein